MPVVRTLLPSAVLLAVACASLTGCQGSGSVSATAAADTPGPGPTASATATAAPSTAAPSTAAPSTTATTARPAAVTTTAAVLRSTGTGAASTIAPCGNADLRTSWGSGTQSQPLQAEAVLFTDIGHRACTLQGYPGVTIANGGTLIDATRVLNGFRGDLPPLTSPPLVTLVPGATASAMVEWRLYDGSACYPTGTGAFEATAPNTTDTIVLSHAVVGRQGICSSLEINPVVPGTGS